MDRRNLLITGAGLTLAGGGFLKGAYAKTADPEPAPPPLDEAPPMQSEPLPPAPPSNAPSSVYRPAPGARAYGQSERAGEMAPPDTAPHYRTDSHGREHRAETFSREEIVHSVSDFLGVTAEAAGAGVERVFAQNGRPTAYIAGEEGSGAFIGGVRYGKGLVYMKNRPAMEIFWQGPTVGWDFGGNASRVFTLCYNLQYPDAIFRRFPGVEGSAYFIGGLGLNYQRAEDITLAPMRAGVGLRLGANVGYLAYSRKRHWIPL